MSDCGDLPPINVHYHSTGVCGDIDDAIYDSLKGLGYEWDSSGYEFDCGLRTILFTVNSEKLGKSGKEVRKDG